MTAVAAVAAVVATTRIDKNDGRHGVPSSSSKHIIFVGISYAQLVESVAPVASFRGIIHMISTC